MSFTSLKDLIPKAANKFHLQGELKAAWVINRASAMVKEIFPEEVSGDIRVKRFTDGVLWISVNSSVLAQEIQHKSWNLKEAINTSLGEQLITQIRSFQEVKSPVESEP